MGKAEMEGTHTHTHAQNFPGLLLPQMTSFHSTYLFIWGTAQDRSIHSQIRKISLDQTTCPARDQTGDAAGDTWGLTVSSGLCRGLNACPGKEGVHCATLYAATCQLRKALQSGRQVPCMDFERGNLKDLSKFQILGKFCNSSLDTPLCLFRINEIH